MSKMKPCPFCGKEVDEYTHGYLFYNKLTDNWVFDHWCDDDIPTNCMLTVRGKTKEEVIERWNHRAEVKTSESL